jgi:hypothetical protein
MLQSLGNEKKNVILHYVLQAMRAARRLHCFSACTPLCALISARLLIADDIKHARIALKVSCYLLLTVV